MSQKLFQERQVGNCFIQTNNILYSSSILVRGLAARTHRHQMMKNMLW